MDAQDNDFMFQAIEESRKSKFEDSRTHPYVGVVVVKNGRLLATAYRGELASGNHAEFTALEGKLPDELIAGATVYTTLEPCTTRNHPKLPCAQRLIERKVGRVVMGMLDPNPQISGKGQIALRKANIQTELFPPEFMRQVEELNRDFIRSQSATQLVAGRFVDNEFVDRHRRRSLDGWYHTVNYIYWDRNFHRDAQAIFMHLVEVTGGLSLLASSKKKPGLVP
jgi:pyrimidine deaminase RibD-like protein